MELSIYERINGMDDYKLIEEFRKLKCKNIFTPTQRNNLNAKLQKCYSLDSLNEYSSDIISLCNEEKNSVLSNTNTSAKTRVTGYFQLYTGFLLDIHFSNSKNFNSLNIVIFFII